MKSNREILKEIEASFEREPRINLHAWPLRMELDAGVLTLEGEVEHVAAKKLALELGGAATGVDGIVDRLRVAPAETMEDMEIRDHLTDAFLQEPAFADYAIHALVFGRWESVREAPREPTGLLQVEADGGIVTLNGQVTSLSHKRLAGVLAWWVPGSRDVVNGIEVIPPEEDNDDEITDAVRLVLEKDPFVNASQLRVGCRDRVVTLDGAVPKPKEKDMAEADAWYVFGVDKVVNRLVVLES
ncbi:BON domain-containing protein [Geobacter pickeringii]|uniref:Transporter n=1 Tax=Geobacter pickeringii TaxID=345632 RepID=A0A0B5BAK8_9BACT|nr:BON domain-containing protein [Geobacter pickeringii]AJE03773.1 transporter [Geobacter pickeringii]